VALTRESGLRARVLFLRPCLVDKARQVVELARQPLEARRDIGRAAPDLSGAPCEVCEPLELGGDDRVAVFELRGAGHQLRDVSACHRSILQVRTFVDALRTLGR